MVSAEKTRCKAGQESQWHMGSLNLNAKLRLGRIPSGGRSMSDKTFKILEFSRIPQFALTRAEKFAHVSGFFNSLLTPQFKPCRTTLQRCMIFTGRVVFIVWVNMVMSLKTTSFREWTPIPAPSHFSRKRQPSNVAFCINRP